MKRFLLLAAWLCLAGPLSAARIGILPFLNESKYKGRWNLGLEIPRYLEKGLGQTYHMIPADSLDDYLKASGLPRFVNSPTQKRQIAKAFGADFLVDARIMEFHAMKRILGEGKYGGIKSFSAEIRLKVRVFSARANETIYSEEFDSRKRETNTSVNLGRISKDEALFDSLNFARFGSEAFDRTIAGAMMKEVLEKFQGLLLKLPETVARKGEDKKLIRNAKVVEVTATDIYINAGSSDNVEPGDVFKVFTKGDSIRDPDTHEFLGLSERYVGQIRVGFVEAGHFSRATVVKKEGNIRLGDIVRIEK
ncbi:MAG: CsgG/HfaB family protein [Fibrobacterota bacterium]